MRQWSRSRLVLAGQDRGLRARVGQMKKRLCLGLAPELDLEPGVWLRSFHLLDPEHPSGVSKSRLSPDPVQECGEEVEDGVVFGVTLRREPVQVAPSPAPADAQPAQAFVQYRSARVRRLKAASLNRLVTHLLDPANQEPDFKHIFLSTYRAFTDTATLVELLFQRDDIVSELDNCESQKSTLMPLIRTWLDEYSEDFWEPPQHRPLRLLSAHLTHRPCYRRLAPRAHVLLKKLQSEARGPAGLVTAVRQPAVLEEEEGTTEEGPVWGSPEKQEDFMSFSVRDIAEELTRLDAALFVKVVPFQCLGCVWSQRDKKENGNLAPSVRATVAQFNAVTNRVITSLLCPPPPAPAPPTPRRQPPGLGPAQRARIIEKWIGVARECRALRNLSSLRAILSALQSNAVYRLRRTWAAVSRECVAVLDNLCETFPDENCVLTSREILVEEGNRPTEDGSSRPRSPNQGTPSRQMNGAGGVVPYLGTYLTALMMLDTAFPDTVGGDLINFEKRRREFEILSQIRQLKQACSQYSLPHHPNIAPWLQECRLLTDQESYDLSRELEPPVDPCPASHRIWNHLQISKKLASFLTSSEGSGRKMHADQISVSSSGSSGSEMEDLATPQSSPLRLKLKSHSKSCQDVGEDFPSSSSSSACPSESCSPSSSSANSQPDLSPSSLCALSPEPCQYVKHQRSMSMISLPVYNKQVDDSCIVRVSVESGNTGNVYKSILLTSQDKTAQVIQRALEKHSLEEVSCQDFTLCQVLSRDKELRIPEKANVFYAMSTSANYDFILRHKWRCRSRPLGSSFSLESATGLCHTTSAPGDLLPQRRRK